MMPHIESQAQRDALIARPTITQAQLKERLHYNPDTGIFTWIGGGDKNKRIGMVAGWKCEQGYIKIELNGRPYKAHRLAFLYMENRFPECVDHANRIRDDNRWINIREATKSNNSHNLTTKGNNKSGCRNVYWSIRAGKWLVKLKCKNKAMSFGYYSDVELADLVARDARAKYHGEFAM